MITVTKEQLEKFFEDALAWGCSIDSSDGRDHFEKLYKNLAADEITRLNQEMELE